MATMPYRAPSNNSSFLSFDTGDVIVLSDIWYKAEQDGWAEGIASKTRAKVWLVVCVELSPSHGSVQGDFPSANVIVLPSIFKPEADVLAAFKSYLLELAPAGDVDMI
jgi:hypothetical protein